MLACTESFSTALWINFPVASAGIEGEKIARSVSNTIEIMAGGTRRDLFIAHLLAAGQRTLLHGTASITIHNKPALDSTQTADQRCAQSSK